jgi:hypothetical protein
VTATKFDSPAFQKTTSAHMLSAGISIPLVLHAMRESSSAVRLSRERCATEAVAAEMRCAGDQFLDVWPIVKAAR